MLDKNLSNRISLELFLMVKATFICISLIIQLGFNWVFRDEFNKTIFLYEHLVRRETYRMNDHLGSNPKETFCFILIKFKYFI